MSPVYSCIGCSSTAGANNMAMSNGEQGSPGWARCTHAQRRRPPPAAAPAAAAAGAQVHAPGLCCSSHGGTTCCYLPLRPLLPMLCRDSADLSLFNSLLSLANFTGLDLPAPDNTSATAEAPGSTAAPGTVFAPTNAAVQAFMRSQIGWGLGSGQEQHSQHGEWSLYTRARWQQEAGGGQLPCRRPRNVTKAEASDGSTENLDIPPEKLNIPLLPCARQLGAVASGALHQ